MTDLLFRGIVLKDFKAFRGEHRFNLALMPGLYYVTGKNLVAPELGGNGVGKSTLLSDAPTWALWGKTARDNRPANSTIPWGMDKGPSSVQLYFSDVEVKRGRRPNELLLNGDTVAQEAVPEALGFSEELFRHTIILGQFGTWFLDLKPEQQSHLFSEALNLDLWLRASRRALDAKNGANYLLGQVRANLAGLTGRIEELTANIAQTSALAEGWEAARKQEVSQAAEALKSASLALARVRPAKGGSEGLKVQVEERRRAFQEAQNIYLKANRSIGALEATRKSKQHDLGEYEAAKVCPECGQKVTPKHLKEKKASLTSDIAALEAEVKLTKGVADGATKAMNAAQADLNQLQAKYNEIAEAERLVARCDSAVQSIAGRSNPHQLKPLQDKMAGLVAEKANLEGQIVVQEKRAKVGEYWADAYKEIRLQLIDDVLAELEMAVGSHAEALGLEGWRVQFQTERQLASGSVSSSFTVLLTPPDQEEAIKWESYSGGESQRWQLAVAFGLSEVLLSHAGVNPSIEVLDEPTRGLSPEGTEALLKHLKARAKELDRAIFFVDHHSLEHGAFDGVFVIEMREDGAHVRKA